LDADMEAGEDGKGRLRGLGGNRCFDDFVADKVVSGAESLGRVDVLRILCLLPSVVRLRRRE